MHRSLRTTHDELPREVDTGSEVVLVLDDLDAGPGLEHHDHVALVEDLGGRVHGDAGEVLDLLRVAVEVDGLLVDEHGMALLVYEDIYLAIYRTDGPDAAFALRERVLKRYKQGRGLDCYRNDLKTFGMQ